MSRLLVVMVALGFAFAPPPNARAQSNPGLSFDAQRVIASVPADRLKIACAEGREAVQKLTRATFNDLNRGNRDKLQNAAIPEANKYFLTKGYKAAK